MSATPEARLADLGLSLPEVPPAAGAYVPAVRTGTYVYTSGQIPRRDGQLLHAGKVGAEVTIAQAAECAELCALNLLAAIKAEVGELSAVTRVVKVLGFVASAPDFTDQPQVVNGASDLLIKVFGDAGQHARSAVGVAALPMGVPVEVEMIVEVS